MLKVQEFLRQGGTLKELETRYAVSAKRHAKYPGLILLKYNQIDSPFDEPIVCECRGLILDEQDDWRAVCMAFPKRRLN